MTNKPERSVSEIVREFTQEFEAELDFTSNPKYVAQQRDIEDYTDWLTQTLTADREAVREEEKKMCETRMNAGYHLTKYIEKTPLISKGMVATLCCCHDAFVIETDEELAEVIKNISDDDEELKYTVVRVEDAHLICGDFDTTIERLNCSRVRNLQALTNKTE